MKIIEKLSKNIEEFVKEFSSLFFLLILMSYIKLFLYLYNYNNIFNPTGQKKEIFSSFFKYSVFSLSFISIILLFSAIISFIIYLIAKKTKFSVRKPIFIISFILELISYIYIYTDLQFYKLMNVHLHNKIVLGAINNKDLENDVAITSSQVINFFTYPLITIILILLFFFLLIYFKTKFNLDNLFNKIMKFLSIPVFLSLIIVMYFWINLSEELTAIPLWSYIESAHISDNFESNYGDNFNYDNIKIKNKKNVIIIIAESFRSDFFNKENTPNMFKFNSRKVNLIKSENHFSGAHFTLNSIFALWYSIYGYHDKAMFNAGNYKQPIPIKLFNKLGYDTQFLTASFLIPSLESIRKATKTFTVYKTFKNDLSMIKFFTNYYNNKPKEKPFITTIFLNSTHYAYGFPDSIAKYKPYISLKDKNLFDMSTSIGKDYKEKAKLVNRYKNSVFYVDFLFNKIVNTLSEEDKKNTIIIFTGDHGEQFWEYNYFGHTKASYVKEAVSVPLLFYIPDLNENIKVKTSSHIDIMTTLLSYITDIESSMISKHFHGISLLDENRVNNNYFIISSFNFMGLKSKIALINKYGKLIIEAKTNKIKDKNLFKIIKFSDFKDKELVSKEKKDYLLDDFKDFQKNYLRFIKMDKK